MKGLFCLIAAPFLVSVVNGCCSGDWRSFKDSCYLFVEEERTWEYAKEDCKQLGGWLVDIADDEENEFILSTKDHYWDYFHIGFTDKDEEGIFKWVSGSSSEYLNFGHGEPNSHKGNEEDCVEIRNTGWNDIPCGKEQYYICEKPSEKSTKA